MSETPSAPAAAPARRAPARDPAPATPRRSPAWAAVLSLLGSLAVVEAALRIVHPLPDPYADYKRVPAALWPGSAYVPSAYPPRFRMTVRAEPGLPGMDPRPRTFSVNGLGFRGDSLAVPKPAGELRVFVVGGSTTECMYLGDAEALTARLQAHLRRLAPGVDVRVYGAGKSGDRSWDHVAMVTHRILHLQPDVIVVFAGVNDLSASIAGRDYLLRADPQEISTAMKVRLALTELQLGRLLQAATSKPDARRVGLTSSVRRAARRVAALPAGPLPRDPDPRPYAENLATIAGAARANGARVVFMTQATTWTTADPRLWGWHWMLGTETRFPEAGLEAGMRRFNAAMTEVGAANGVPVFDLSGALPKSADDFYDDVHFTARGADAAAALLARFMVDQGVIAPVPSPAGAK